MKTFFAEFLKEDFPVPAVLHRIFRKTRQTEFYFNIASVCYFGSDTYSLRHIFKERKHLVSAFHVKFICREFH